MQQDYKSRRTRRRVLLCACLLAVSPLTRSVPAETGTPVEFTLEQALEQAFRESPVLAARRAEVRRAEARLIAARTYPYNPEIELATADRQGLADGSTDRSLSLSQEIEVGGQRGKRAAVATAELGAVQSLLEREQRLLAARVRLAFAEALRAIELVQIAEADAELTRQLLDFEHCAWPKRPTRQPAAA